MQFPLGLGVDAKAAEYVFEYVRSQRPQSWTELAQRCAKAEIYLSTIGRMRGGHGSDVFTLFAGAENLGSNRDIENLQLLMLGARYSEYAGPIGYHTNAIGTYFSRGACLRILLFSVMNHKDFAGTRFAEAHIGHTSGTTLIPDMKAQDLRTQLGPFLKADPFLTAKKVVEFLSNTFGPLSPAAVTKIGAVFGEKPTSAAKKAPRHQK